MNFEIKPDHYFSNYGYCVCCDQPVQFIAEEAWLRDHYLCASCNSIPRERALIYWLEYFFPNWKQLNIHESSPIFRGASQKLKQFCEGYLPSYFFYGKEDGGMIDGFLNINLESQRLPDESFDLVITQDIFEHLYNPASAFKEIQRTLKVGGAHIFTVPLVNKNHKTQQWSERKEDGAIKFFYEEEYHGNPIDQSGSPVAWHWGYDISNYIFDNTGMNSIILLKEDITRGLQAELMEVIITFKN
jgi:SAM-dependent methyltransferase